MANGMFLGMPGSAPYVPGPAAGAVGNPITGAQTGIGAGSSAMSPMNAAMSPMMAAVLGTGVEALLPYGIDFLANAYDGLSGQGKQDGRRLAEREKLFAGLQGQWMLLIRSNSTCKSNCGPSNWRTVSSKRRSRVVIF